MDTNHSHGVAQPQIEGSRRANGLSSALGGSLDSERNTGAIERALRLFDGRGDRDSSAREIQQAICQGLEAVDATLCSQGGLAGDLSATRQMIRVLSAARVMCCNVKEAWELENRVGEILGGLLLTDLRTSSIPDCFSRGEDSEAVAAGMAKAALGLLDQPNAFRDYTGLPPRVREFLELASCNNTLSFAARLIYEGLAARLGDPAHERHLHAATDSFVTQFAGPAQRGESWREHQRGASFYLETRMLQVEGKCASEASQSFRKAASLVLNRRKPLLERCAAVLSLRESSDPKAGRFLEAIALGEGLPGVDLGIIALHRRVPRNPAIRAAAFEALGDRVFEQRRLRGAALAFLCEERTSRLSRFEYLGNVFQEVEPAIVSLTDSDCSGTASLAKVFRWTRACYYRGRHTFFDDAVERPWETQLPLRVSIGGATVRIGRRRDQIAPNEATDFLSIGELCASESAELLARVRCVEKAFWETPHKLSELVGAVRPSKLSSYFQYRLVHHDALDVLLSSPRTLGKVEQFFSTLGIEAVKYEAQGGRAFAFSARGELIVRMLLDDVDFMAINGSSLRPEPKRLLHPAILQPLCALKAGPIKVEIFPKLETNGITDEELAVLRAVFKSSGLELPIIKTEDGNTHEGDVRRDNVGRAPDGTVYLFDSEHVNAAAPKDWILKPGPHLATWHTESGEWRQHRSFAHLYGLVDSAKVTA